MSGASAATIYEPGEWIAEKNAIFIGEFDDLVRADVPVPLAKTAYLGIRTRWFDAGLDLAPDTFYGMVKVIAESKLNGRIGLHLDPARYEEELFEKLRSGEAVGKYVLAPQTVIAAIHGLKNKGEYKRRSDENLPGKLRIDGGGTGFDRWQWSCSVGRYGVGYMRIVDFTDGYNSWEISDGNLLSGRACFAELAP
jgi:hypothetical protein